MLCLLIARVETRAKAELSKRLAPLDYAPFEVIQHLAWDDEIEVAGNVLANSSRLGTDVLVEIASSKGQDHLLAISGRPNLPAAVTDVIVDRGEDQVIRKLANNAGAQFSEEGYSSIVARASADDELVEILGLRGDLPVKLHARPAAPRQGCGPRPPAGHRAARDPGGDQAGPERDRPRGAAPGAELRRRRGTT